MRRLRAYLDYLRTIPEFSDSPMLYAVYFKACYPYMSMIERTFSFTQLSDSGVSSNVTRLYMKNEMELMSKSSTIMPSN